jgi:alkanesulfonate monooxygenase SsuD/methylene tetrahydromethanopterin reductase-like flavin-dependent oxidoreductase (luciferase family)
MVKFDLDLDSGVIYPGLTMVDMARIAEENGFNAIWKGESNSADPMICLTAMATGTRTIGLGTAVYHVFGRSPVTLGIQAATLNDLSNGRLLLGLGVSNATIAGWHGMTFDRPLRRLREYADVVRQTVRGERVDYEGEIYGTKGFKLSWKPNHPELPIFFAGLGEQMTKLAGRTADGVMVNMADPKTLREIFGRVRQAATEAGRDPDSIEYITKVRVSLNADPEVAKGKLKSVLAFYNLAPHYRDMIAGMGYAEESAAVREEYARAGFRAAQASVPDSLVDNLPTIAAATAAEAFERMQPYLDTGVTRMIIPYLPSTDDPVEETAAFLRSWPTGVKA